MTTATLPKTQTRFLTIRQFAEAHPWPSAPALRHIIFENQRDFAKRCVKRIGRRVLLDEAAVLAWIGDAGCEA